MAKLLRIRWLLSRPCADQGFNRLKVPLVGSINTHHDDQENILEILPMSESVLDEEGKVSLQEL